MAEAIVCGAGAAGLAAAATLGGAGVHAVVLERSNHLGASWRSRYDGLRLNTPAWMSTLPGYRARHSKYGEYPSRDDWVRYLEDYADYHQIDVRFGADVQRLSTSRDGWRIDTNGEALQTTFVVVATGYEREPYIPDWTGREGYEGELIHSSVYRNPRPYRGRDVLVVGPNVTGSEVANLLVKGGAGRVRVACRTPPNVMARKFLGLTVSVPGIVLNHLPSRIGDEVGWLMQRILFGRLDRYGIPRSPMGVATTMARRRQSPAFGDGFVDEVRAGRIEIVAAVAGFDRGEVVLADGARIRPEVVIAATGYRRGLEDLVGQLGVLDVDGHPIVSGGQDHPLAPGLFSSATGSTLADNCDSCALMPGRLRRLSDAAGFAGKPGDRALQAARLVSPNPDAA